MIETPKNVKLTCYVPERIRRALNISSARSGRSVGGIMTELVEASLLKDLELADESISEGQPPAKGKTGPKPRKGKPAPPPRD